MSIKSREHTTEDKLLVCLYLCVAHERFLDDLMNSSLGAFIRSRPCTTVLRVYGNPALEQDTLQGDRLIVRAEEAYAALSLKTHRMISACCGMFEFDRLLKIDVTVARSDFSQPQYARQSPIDLDRLLAYVTSAPMDADYHGFKLLANAGRQGAEMWASKKGQKINYTAVFGNDRMCPYYTGKLYILSRRFAEFVDRMGADIAREQLEHFLGSEDVMIGRLYQAFLESQR